MGGQGFQWGRESDLGGLKSGEGVLNKMQMPQSHTILWEEGRWAPSLVSCVGRDAGMLKVLNQVQGTERGLSVKQPTIWGVQQSLAHAGSALGPVAWSLHSLCHTPMPTPPPAPTLVSAARCPDVTRSYLQVPTEKLSWDFPSLRWG